MDDPTRTRIDAGLADVLTRQLRALVDDWEPVDRHPVRMSHAGVSEDTCASMARGIGDGRVWVDDLNALIARSFDYEAVEWLWHYAVSDESVAELKRALEDLDAPMRSGTAVAAFSVEKPSQGPD